MQAANIFFHAAKMHFMQLFDWNLFSVFVQKMPKNANYEEFLTKFVNINNHTHHFLHGVQNLQDAKNHSQHEEIFDAWQKQSQLFQYL